jgi:hypothetical protein
VFVGGPAPSWRRPTHRGREGAARSLAPPRAADVAARRFEVLSGGGRETVRLPAAKTPGAPSTIAPPPTGHRQRREGWNMPPSGSGRKGIPPPPAVSAAVANTCSSPPPYAPRCAWPKRPGWNIGGLGCLFVRIAGVAALSPPRHDAVLRVWTKVQDAPPVSTSTGGRELRRKSRRKRVLHSTSPSTRVASESRAQI